MSPQEPKAGDRVTVDQTTADEEVAPAPKYKDKDQGRETEEPKEPAQREQIFPDN